MAPCEEALDRLGASVAARHTHSHSWAPALQMALPARPYRFTGEVPQSCTAMLRKWANKDNKEGDKSGKNLKQKDSR